VLAAERFSLLARVDVKHTSNRCVMSIVREDKNKQPFLLRERGAREKHSDFLEKEQGGPHVLYASR